MALQMGNWDYNHIYIYRIYIYIGVGVIHIHLSLVFGPTSVGSASRQSFFLGNVGGVELQSSAAS